MSETKIQIRNLHKAFGKKVVLDGIDLDIVKGESLVVIGGSGTGKSVLIKCIQGLLTPDEGSILVDEKEVVVCQHYIGQRFFAFEYQKQQS